MNFVRVFKNLLQFNRTNWKAVLLCLFAAAIFWVFNAFNKSHTSTIRFPLHFDFDNERYVTLKPLPHHISINVTGSGWDLVRKTFGMKLPELVIPLERPVETKKIPASSLMLLLSSQLQGLKVNYIVTDTLTVSVEKKISKTFRLSIDLSRVKFKEGFGPTGTIEIMPETVLIDGPKSIVNSIPDTIVLPVQGKQLSRSFTDELEVPLFGNESINRNPPVISIKVEVGSVETVEEMVKVKMVNQPRGLVKTIFTDSVKVFIRIPANQSEDFRKKRLQVKAILDLKDATKGSQQVLPKIIGLPIYAQVVSIDSVSFKID